MENLQRFPQYTLGHLIVQENMSRKTLVKTLKAVRLSNTFHRYECDTLWKIHITQIPILFCRNGKLPSERIRAPPLRPLERNKREGIESGLRRCFHRPGTKPDQRPLWGYCMDGDGWIRPLRILTFGPNGDPLICEARGRWSPMSSSLGGVVYFIVDSNAECSRRSYSWVLSCLLGEHLTSIYTVFGWNSHHSIVTRQATASSHGFTRLVTSIICWIEAFLTLSS